MATCLDCKVLPPESIVLCPLHAAAEDLLAALQAVVSHNEGYMDCDACAKIYSRARAAIAKASA